MAGRIFVFSLVLCFFSILFNIVLQKNVSMFGIGWLAVYAGIEGWRSLLRFRGSLAPEPTAFDYAVAGTNTLICLGLLGFGMRVFAVSSNPLGLVCVGFGLLGVGLVRGAWKRWKEAPPRSRWLAVHIGMMTGAFSAALTAFLAIQLSGRIGGFEWIVWVAPTLLMSRYGAYETKRRGLEPSE